MGPPQDHIRLRPVNHIDELAHLSRDQVSRHTNEELQTFLQARGLECTGDKRAVVNRLFKFFSWTLPVASAKRPPIRRPDQTHASDSEETRQSVLLGPQAAAAAIEKGEHGPFSDLLTHQSQPLEHPLSSSVRRTSSSRGSRGYTSTSSQESASRVSDLLPLGLQRASASRPSATRTAAARCVTTSRKRRSTTTSSPYSATAW